MGIISVSDLKIGKKYAATVLEACKLCIIAKKNMPFTLHDYFYVNRVLSYMEVSGKIHF